MENNSILRNIVQEPVNFNRWVIFCLKRDKNNGLALQDEFYNLSKKRNL